VVNAAGVVGFGTLADMDPEAVETLVRVDLLGPLALMRAALAHLDGGFVVNLTGVVAEQPVAGLSVYSAAKAGLSAATRALSRELRRRRILVVDARPPHTETGLALRPVAGEAPRLPEGLDPTDVAERIIRAIEAGEREVPAAAFTSEPA
jgi:cyclic-di-GMP-binding biofilm dispersal mediator protein